MGDEPAFATADLLMWIEKVHAVTEARDQVVHAIALDQCMRCGDASTFRHPRSGDDVDRSREAVTAIKEAYDDLRTQGLTLAADLAKAVNERIFIEAKRIANSVDEIQNPPQVSPHNVEHMCPSCSGGAGQTVAHAGRALEVVPDLRWHAYMAGTWPSQPSA